MPSLVVLALRDLRVFLDAHSIAHRHLPHRPSAVFQLHAIILDGDRSLTGPIKQSWRCTRGRWLHTFTLTLAFQLLGLLPGPLIGVLLLIIGGTNVKFCKLDQQRALCDLRAAFRHSASAWRFAA